jgi:hypothetical protein
MYLNGEQADVVRAAAVKYVTGVLPFTRGSPDYKEICQGYSKKGTTCTFLPHWMLWKIGVSSNNKSLGTNGLPRGLINRTEPSRGTKLIPGDGVSVIANCKVPDAFVRMTPTTKAFPSAGDIVVIQSDPYNQKHEHVFVFLAKLSETEWDTGESGQAAEQDPDGVVEAKRKSRVMRITAKKIIAAAAEGKPDRNVQGWLDISKLDYVSWPP